MHIQISLGQRIRQLREERDLSVRELARKLELSPAFLSDVELGRRHPSRDNLSRIAQILRTPVSELIELDTRADADELHRLASTNPAYGFAFRQLLNENLSPEELLALVEKNRAQRRKK